LYARDIAILCAKVLKINHPLQVVLSFSFLQLPQLLPKEAQEERKLMTWRRVLPPYQGEKEADTKYLGMALTPHVRESWRADSELGCDCPETAPSSSSSSSSSSESSDDSEASDDESSSDSASE